MAVGWALVKRDEEEKFDKVFHLTEEAAKANMPWADAVQFTVYPLEPTLAWSDPPNKIREWDAIVEIDGISRKNLGNVFQFIHNTCSHVDGVG